LLSLTVKWYQKEIKKFFKETFNTTVFALLFLFSVSVWHFFLGQGYQWQTITPVPEPSMFNRLLYSALTFVTLGALLYKLKFYQVLYYISGDRRSFQEAKKIVWVVLVGLMFFIIIPTTVNMVNHILSFGYNILNFIFYLFPPFGGAVILAIGLFYFRRSALYQKLSGEDLDKMPSIEDITLEAFFRTPQRIKECAASGIDINKCERDILSKNNNIQKYVYQACKQIQTFGISYQKFLKEIGNLNKKGHELTDSEEMVVRSFEKEANLMLRSAVELYIESWNFARESKKEEAIRAYYLVKTLQAFFKRNRNSEKYCDYPQQGDILNIVDIRKELKNLTTTFFFFAKGKNLQKDKDVIHLTKSYTTLLDEALKHMTPRERFALGESYQQYVNTSDSIHGYAGSPVFEIDDVQEFMKVLYGGVYILAVYTQKNLTKIGSGVLPCQGLLDALDGIESDDFNGDLKIDIGDSVLVKRQIKAVVKNVMFSDYGCARYEVEFNDKRGDASWSFEKTLYLRKDLQKLPTIVTE